MNRQPGEQSRRRGAGARASFGLAWLVCLPCVALASGSLLLASLNGRTLGEVLVEEGLITLAVLTAAGLAALVSLVFRFCRVRGDGRQQIKWFVYAAVLTLSWTFVIDGLPDRGSTFEAVIDALGLVVAPSIPVATGLVIFRHRLYDIDRVINRTLVYGALTAPLILVYAGSVVPLQYGLRSVSGGGSQLAIVASILAIAALFSPLRRRIQGFIERRFYRKKYDAQETLAVLSARLRVQTNLEALGDDLVVVARETVQPAHGSLWLRKPMVQEGRGRDV